MYIKVKNGEEFDQPFVAFSIPLFVRIMELAREDIKSDLNLHKVIEQIVKMGVNDYLSIDAYAEIETANPKK
jgi:hypothetical protein